jgi:hypothetical protein
VISSDSEEVWQALEKLVEMLGSLTHLMAEEFLWKHKNMVIPLYRYFI